MCASHWDPVLGFPKLNTPTIVTFSYGRSAFEHLLDVGKSAGIVGLS